MVARYCTNCGRALTDAEVWSGVSTCATCAASAGGSSYTPAEDISLPGQPPGGQTTVNLRIDYPERLSRWMLFVKWLFVIPAYILLAFYGLAVFVTTFISFWAILFTGRYPSGLFDFATGYMAMQAQTYAYFPLLLTDQYPLGSDVDSTVHYEVEEPEGLSRGLLLLKLATLLLSVVGTLTSIAGLVIFLVAIPAWFIILFVGRIPRGMFNFMVAVAQWTARVTAWQWLLRDEWSLFATTRPVAYLVGAGAAAAVVLTISNYAVGPATGGFDFETGDGQNGAEFIIADTQGEEGEFIDDVLDIDQEANRDYWSPVGSSFATGACDVAAASDDQECAAAMLVLEDRDPVLVQALEELNSLDPPTSLLRDWRDKLAELMDMENRSSELIIEGWQEDRESTWQEGWELSARTIDVQLELNDLTAQVVEEYGN